MQEVTRDGIVPTPLKLNALAGAAKPPMTDSMDSLASLVWSGSESEAEAETEEQAKEATIEWCDRRMGSWLKFPGCGTWSEVDTWLPEGRNTASYIMRGMMHRSRKKGSRDGS